MDKVYALGMSYDNGESYEDHYYCDDVIGMFSTLEKAKEAMISEFEKFKKDYKHVYTENKTYDEVLSDLGLDIHVYNDVSYMHNCEVKDKHISWCVDGTDWRNKGEYCLYVEEYELDKIKKED